MRSQVPRRPAQDRMTPVRKHFRKGPHDEKPLLRPGMGQYKVWSLQNGPTKGDEIEIQGA